MLEELCYITDASIQGRPLADCFQSGPALRLQLRKLTLSIKTACVVQEYCGRGPQYS